MTSTTDAQPGDVPASEPSTLRASDGDREVVGRILHDAAGSGLLTLDETEERLAAACAARNRHELTPLTADLPVPSPDRDPPGWASIRSAVVLQLRTNRRVAIVCAVLVLGRVSVPEVATMRVLLVEDQPLLAEAVRRGLLAEHIAADVCHNGPDGLDAAAAGRYDVVVLDIMLPGLSGYRVSEELRRRGIGRPVMMLTAKDGEYDEADAFDLGADDYLVKPFSMVVLLAPVALSRPPQRRRARPCPARSTATWCRTSATSSPSRSGRRRRYGTS